MYNWILGIKKDKLLHFSVGVVITSLLSLFIALWLAFICAALVSIAKEVWDYYTGGNVELWDVLSTMLGAAVVIIPAALI